LENRIKLDVHEIPPFQDVLPHAAFVLHPDLLQDSSRSRVVFEMSSEDAVQVGFLKSVFHHGTCRLGGISLAPIWNANPVPQFRALVFRIGMQPEAANQSSASAQPDAEPEFVLTGRAVEEFSRMVLGEGMRNA